MDKTVRFALVTKPNDATRKPFTFNDLGELAASIHRRRGSATLQMIPADIFVQGEEKARSGVSLFKIDQGADRADYLGWAYLEGAGSPALESALRIAHPDAPTIRRWAA